MPCYDSRRDYHDSGESWIARAERLQERCDLLARLLCNAMKALGSARYGMTNAEARELDDWWKEHQEFDRKRAKEKK